MKTLKQGDKVILVSIHHSMNSDLKKFLNETGTVEAINFDKDEYSVEFFKGCRGSWWIKGRHLKHIENEQDVNKTI